METILLAGATGALGRQIVPILTQAGYSVAGTTRSAAGVRSLEEAGVRPVLLDVLDPAAVRQAVQLVRPDILVNMITDLPKDLNAESMVEGRVRNARVWREGTRNLMQAAKCANTQRAIAQSLAWLYAPGQQPHPEDHVLGTDDDDERIILDAVLALEKAVLDTSGIKGIVLRYGLLYGPGTSSEVPQRPCSLHVAAAAHAVLLAIKCSQFGVYNIADDNPQVSTAKAKRELGWAPDFRGNA